MYHGSFTCLTKKKKKKGNGNIPVKGTQLNRRNMYSDTFSKRDIASEIHDTHATLDQLITLKMPVSKVSERRQFVYVTIFYQCTVLQMFSAGA